jgi:hypothetical protein
VWVREQGNSSKSRESEKEARAGRAELELLKENNTIEISYFFNSIIL